MALASDPRAAYSEQAGRATPLSLTGAGQVQSRLSPLAQH